MISWMQKHNKYLVITIWVATIAFIGAGFVGWGSVNFGSKANSVAKVGDVNIPISKYSFNYNNLYAQYAQKFKGKFDKKEAEKLGLGKAVLSNLINEALLLNFAKENGIITTDKEVALEIISFPQFKDKNGAFNKDYYEAFLRNRGLKAKDFERILKDEITVRKLLKLIDVKPLSLEKEAMASTLNIADKIKYKVLKSKDIEVKVDEAELKNFWEKNKLNYLTKQEYKLDLLWTNPKDLNITDSEIEEYYKANSFNYTNKDGKVLDLKDAKEAVLNDLKLKKIKKQAVIERSRLKKGKLKPTESLTLKEGDSKLTPEIWAELKNSKSGTYLKPKAIKDRYLTLHLVDVVKPKVMSYEEAKELVLKEYKAKKQEEELNKLVEKSLKNSNDFNIEPKDYITLSKFEVLPNLTPQDSALVTRALFGSDKKINSVKVSDGVVVYEVVEQKILDNNDTTNSLDKEIATIKSSELTSNLLKDLSSKYTTEVFIKDIK